MLLQKILTLSCVLELESSVQAALASSGCATPSSLHTVNGIDLTLGKPHRVLEAQPRNGSLSGARRGRSAGLDVGLNQRVVNSRQRIESEDGCVGAGEAVDLLEKVAADEVVVAARLKVLLQVCRIFEPG
jgi:hypothetical protein